MILSIPILTVLVRVQVFLYIDGPEMMRAPN
jgi:hypothetical protein